MSKGLETAFLKAKTAEKRGDSVEARRLYAAILEQFPNNIRARRAMEQLAATVAEPAASQPPLDRLLADFQAGRLAELVAAGEALRPLHPRSAGLHHLLGLAYAGLRDLAQAEAAFARALPIDPKNPQLHFNLGAIWQEQGQFDRAVQAYRQVLLIQPDHGDAYFNLGGALHALRRLDDAIIAYRRALVLRPDNAPASYNLGNALKDLDRIDEAMAAYDRALAIDPNYVPAHNNRGIALQRQKRLGEAILSYRQALAIDPGHADAWNNLGNALRESGELGEAITAYTQAIDRHPGFAAAHNNLGNAYRDSGDFPQAVACYARALDIMPGWPTVLAQKLHQQAQMCDWTAFDEFAAAADRIGIGSGAVPPFTVLNFEDDPARQLLRSECWARETYGGERPLPAPAPRPGKRIRIGYFSADFHNHATLFLMAGLFRTHDRQRFEIHAYSYGTVTSGTMRDALIADVDSFTDVKAMSDLEIATLARSHGLDIAVDLKGYTAQNRTSIFAHRPAPVQISYLGYPGSLGADFMDYILADPVVIPDGDESFYSEKLIRLPHSYQPNDDQRDIATTATVRADHGLPEQGFVFCCFNNNYKIAPEEFDIWMRLLAQVEGSVLWLLRSNPFAEANLRKAATDRGIDGERVIFAGRMDLPEHLARHAHADLFLDTFNYNAHTTASDALWAGLPLVTLAGRQFSARVGASLVTAAGLPELITTSSEAYERLALDLATSPERLGAIRAKLGATRTMVPLFDSALYARHIEAAYEAAHRRHVAGLDPDHIRIAP